MKTIANRQLSLTVDDKGRIISLLNKRTGTELIDCPEEAEAWRMVLPSGRHTIDFVYGSQQTPASIQVTETGPGPALTIVYDTLVVGGLSLPIRAEFTLTLHNKAGTVVAAVHLDNRSERAIDEVEFPVIGGLGGFADRKGQRSLDLIAGRDVGTFFPEVMYDGFPNLGTERDPYVRRLDTALFEYNNISMWGKPVWTGMWLDFWCAREGLYFEYCPEADGDFAISAG